MATISKTDSGTWKVLIRKARFGVPQLYKTFSRKEDAEAWGRKTESEIERGAWRDVGGADRMTFGQALTKYSEEEAAAHRGGDPEQSHIRTISCDELVKLTLSRITRSDVRAMRTRWEKAGYAVATINRRLGIVHAMFECARESWGMAGLDNPASNMGLEGEVQRERRVSHEEFETLLMASKSVRLRAAASVAVETAMRRGELCAMSWSMIDLDKGVVRLPRNITKSARARDVPLSPAAITTLRDLRSSRAKQEDLVFGGLKPHSLTQALMRAVKRGRQEYLTFCATSGHMVDPDFLVDLHFHDLRHEAISRLACIFSLHELMKIVGHSSSTMLQRYYHPRAEDFAQRLRERSQTTASAAIATARHRSELRSQGE
ncbi:MAG: tyrosine-type recombinase/integrase [Rhodanobacter sp.]